ncbi:MAG TPA: cytochrome c-type biogenesis protein [Steroidobacteraceae bacterium]|jgi:cytochrome c-type biogenesis protein CcmH|nr:cytochrome c-type biogenesis protein [Steroidobacteraceae bacterium]
MSRRLGAMLLSGALALGAAQSLNAQDAQGVQGALGQAPAPSPAWDDHSQLQDPKLQRRFERITKELRCLQCQNESIADSPVDLAADLRRQVREMLIAGRSDDAIFKFMTDRYGEFVRFAPPLSPKTALIWGAPFFMLLLGGAIVFRVVRQRSRMPIEE